MELCLYFLTVLEGDAGTAVHTGVNFGTAHDRITVCVHNAGSSSGVGVNEVGVSGIVRSLQIAITKRGLQNGEFRDSLAVTLELGFAFLIGCFDSGLNLGNGAGVALRDNQADAVLRSATVDGLRLPDICVALAGFRASDDLHGIYRFYILTHNLLPP